ncbi:MAG: AAA family ATPase [bacterium]|nr:AAA family ATPase [bacterium]
MTQTQALAILKTGTNVFLTGEPGSGKTFLINEYISYLRRWKIEPAVTASTGIAATHISGMTIHSWSGIGVREKLDKYALDSIVSTERIVKRIENTQILIIDEISMLSADTLSMVDSVCREVRRSPNAAFGGLQVIFVGDFFQLPPISRDNRVRFAYDSSAWVAADPVVCYLTQQYRQDDRDFLAVLNSIRGNTFQEEHKHLLEIRKKESTEVPKSIPRFFPHNADVDRVNEDTLAKLPGQVRKFIMSEKGKHGLVDSLKKGCLSPEQLFLKTGAAVMFTKNNSKSGFVNGTLGVVRGFSSSNGLPTVKTRSNRIITVEPAEWTLEENGRIRAKIIQIPLRLAWAITVHKSQGMSLDEAAMDLSHVFEYGQGYVALSRVRRLSGLHIFGWNERTFQVHPDILARDQVFRQASLAAETAIASLFGAEIEEKQNNFAIKCGGQAEVESTELTESWQEMDTYTATYLLWTENKTIQEIAATRQLKESTILSHIEKLSRQNKIRKSDLSRLLTPALARALPEIHAAFGELGSDKLSTVNQKFFGRYPYDALRIARIIYFRN